ncbi:MAG: hypothetical protein K2X27_25960, partial [Candidatus Obscuribacterales bacterium]|nr:hypothetical protein [Candidatus Obscuribacterales bacterium]
FFPKAFSDQRYLDWEHDYKWEAHKLFTKLLSKEEFKALLRSRDYSVIASRALKIESKTSFLFSFEKMALKDALAVPEGAATFAEGLYELLYESGDSKSKFVKWIMAVAELPRKKSRVLSWPVLTFFPYIAQPKKHMIMKPTAMIKAAKELSYDLEYSSKPSYSTYERLMHLADLTGEAIADLNPKNYHDLQTFLWIIGSSEYEQLEEEI